MSRTVFIRVLLCVLASQSDDFRYIGGRLIGANVGDYGDVAELLVAILVVERKNTASEVIGRKIACDNIFDDVIALSACENEQSLAAISVLQRQSTANVDRDDGYLAALNNGVDLLGLGAEIISAIYRSFEEASLLYSVNELVVREEAIMSVRLAETARARGSGSRLLHSVGIHKPLRYCGLAASRRANEAYDAALREIGLFLREGAEYHFYKMQKVLVRVDRQKSRKVGIPGLTEKNGVSSRGACNIMRSVVEEDVEADYILARADEDVLGRNFGKIFYQSLRSRRHTYRGYGGNEENVGDRVKTAYKLNGTGQDRL